MRESYRTVAKEGRGEFIEKRSRFIGTVRPVRTEEEAVGFIEELRKKYRDASHNVYAYIIENNNIARYSDDGEPSGTAGVPVLDILKKEGLTDLAVVVTRYFGGVLLGTGGLVRAYSKGAKLAVDAAGIANMVLCRETRMSFEYTLLGKIQSELRNRGLACGEPVYTDSVMIPVYIPIGEFQKVKEDFAAITNGTVSFIDGNASYMKSGG